jgi:HK97 family phage portal protein
MGLWGRMRNALRREQPTSRLLWMAPDQPSGIWITPQNALDASVVWACVMAITNAIAPSSWRIFRMEGEKRTYLPDDRLDYVLNVRPNPEMTAIAFREAMSVQALTWGNAYAEIVPNARGDVAELWPLFSDRMTPVRSDAGALSYQYVQFGGELVFLPPERVYHLHGAGIAGLVGDNQVARMAKSIGLASAQERYASTYFGNNTIIGGVLKHPTKLKDQTTKDRLQKDWTDKYGGPFKANKPIILEEGMEWLPFDNNAENAQLVASRMFQIEEICRWYGVPPHKVQHLLRSTFNNIEHQSIEFVRDGVLPWARRYEQEADFKLLPQRAPWRKTSIDTAWLTQGDFKTRMEGYAIGRNIGMFSVNDLLRKEGENTIGAEGDIRLAPANMTRLELVGTQPAGSAGPGSQPGADAADAGADGRGERPGRDGARGARRALRLRPRAASAAAAGARGRPAPSGKARPLHRRRAREGTRPPAPEAGRRVRHRDHAPGADVRRAPARGSAPRKRLGGRARGRSEGGSGAAPAGTEGRGTCRCRLIRSSPSIRSCSPTAGTTSSPRTRRRGRRSPSP